jgi:hypothetical protein
VANALQLIWTRFLWLSWTGKGVAAFAVLYGSGWVLGAIGLDSAARSLGGLAITVASILVTGLVIRTVWRNYTH